MDIFPDSLSLWPRLALVLGMVVAAHISVRIIRIVSNQIAGRMMDRALAKAKTINSLVTSTIVFMLYFAAVGIALTELGVPLTAYFASASVIGLAVAFGSQGVVQDVVTGVTAVLADQFDVGEMVEINGQAGIVEKMGIRFTVLRNAFGARVMIPNRTIGNVIVYPRGYVRILADVSLPDDPALAAQVADKARQVAGMIHDELPGVLRAPLEFLGPFESLAGGQYLRIKFRVWPGRNGVVETVFRQRLVPALRLLDPDFADWMVTVNLEIDDSNENSRHW